MHQKNSRPFFTMPQAMVECKTAMEFGDIPPENREDLDNDLSDLPEEPTGPIGAGVVATDRADGKPDIDDNDLPLGCIDTEGDQLGEKCPNCSHASCKAFAAGRLIVGQRAEIAGLREQVAELTRQNEEYALEQTRLLERILGLQTDTLIITAFSPKGLKDHMEHDPELFRELQEKRWGVLRLDGRFVNYINRFGNLVGDDFLEAGGSHITALADGLVRVQDRRVDPKPPEGEERRVAERRAGHTLTQDIICRQGGDEIALLIRNVSPRDLAAVAARIQSKLTVSSAIGRYEEGSIPFIASVGFAHARNLEPEVTAALTNNDPWLAFRKIAGLADEGQRTVKTQQYQEMWDTVVASMPAEEIPETITQPNDRVVAASFLKLLCPDFYENPVSFLRRQS